MTFFYIDANDQKQGPVTGQQLKELAAQGIIEPHTPLETDSRHRIAAGQILGLFSKFNPEDNVRHMAPVYGPPPHFESAPLHFESANPKIGFLKRLFNKIFGKK